MGGIQSPAREISSPGNCSETHGPRESRKLTKVVTTNREVGLLELKFEGTAEPPDRFEWVY